MTPHPFQTDRLIMYSFQGEYGGIACLFCSLQEHSSLNKHIYIYIYILSVGFHHHSTVYKFSVK